MARAGLPVGNWKTSAAIALLAALAALSGSAAAGPGAPLAEFIEVAAQACPALLMRPANAQEKLASLGFKEADARALGPGWVRRTFERPGPDQSIMIARLTSKTFPDATFRTCFFDMQSFDMQKVTSGMLDVAALRTRLEADPDIGRLDGDVGIDIDSLARKSADRMAIFKRPGDNPVLTIQINKLSRVASVLMTRIDLFRRR